MMIPFRSRRFRALLVMLTAFIGANGVSHAETVEWVYQGLLTRVDPALAPDMQSGWVLSGSFVLDPLQLDSEPLETDLPRAGRLAGGLMEAELTVDLYHRVLFSARQSEGLAGLDYRENEPDADGRDLLGWFIPVEGKLGLTDWQATWLQVWLADSEGKMLSTVPPAIPPGGFAWSQAWFRLTFRGPDGESALAEGRIDVFAPAGALDEASSATAWRFAVNDLAEQLLQRDKELVDLREQLDSARARVQSLQRMLDLMLEERNHLQEELQRLSAQADLADPSVVSRMEALTAEKVLLEAEVARLDQLNNQLGSQLEQSRQARERLQVEVEAAQQAMVKAEQMGSTEEAPVVSRAIPDVPAQPQNPDAGPRPSPSLSADASPGLGEELEAPARESRRPTPRFGPRRFR